MLKITESATFTRQADAVWSVDERLEFFAWIAQNPLAGDVVPGTGGARKVRWSRPGMGKRGGTRIIYFHQAEDGSLLMVMMYVKNERESVSPRQIERAM